MRVLAFDTSGPDLSAAVGEVGKVLARAHERLERGHADRLLPSLGEILAETGWHWQDVELVAVVVGPGNFTGLRAGIAVARALSLALGCRVLGLGALELVAEAAARAGAAGRPILAVRDARRGELYAQPFGPGLEPFGPATLVPRDALAGAAKPGWVIAGDGVALAGIDLAVAETVPDGRDLLALVWRRLAAGALPGEGTELKPLYLRPPDARPGAGASLLAARA